jgi:hypothetical protein
MKKIILIALILVVLTQAASIRMLQTSESDSNDAQVTCTTDADCSNGDLCNTNSGFCAKCLQDSDCDSGLQCITSEGECGHRCNVHDDCFLNAHCDYTTSPYSCHANRCTHNGDCP